MLRIEPCGSIAELLRAQRLAEEAADKQVQEWQKRIKAGDCFKRLDDGLEIFGEVLESDERNWRICSCYSFACPEGETGRVHVSQMDILIGRKTFESVKNKLGKAYRLAIRKLEAEGFSI